MFAMGPEFFNFMKKLEENGDKLTSSTPFEQPLDFEFNVSILIFWFKLLIRTGTNEVVEKGKEKSNNNNNT